MYLELLLEISKAIRLIIVTYYQRELASLMLRLYRNS